MFMTKEIKCPKCSKCGSINTKKFEDKDDFLPCESENEPVRRAKIKTKQRYYCLDCNHAWDEGLVI